MMELIAVQSLDTDKRTLSLLLFRHMKLPAQAVSLSITEPDNMMSQLERAVPEAQEFSSRMRTQLIAIFHETLNSLITGNPEPGEIDLLLVALGPELDVSTIYQKRDRKLARLQQLVRRLEPQGKPRFVHLLYEKLLRADPNGELLAAYVRYCMRRGEGDRLLDWLDIAGHVDAAPEDALVSLAAVAISHQQFDTGEALCDRVLSKNYGNVPALLGKAQCRYQKGEPDFLVYVRKAFQFNKRITVETMTERFEFRKRTRMDVFDVVSLKDAMAQADIPPEALRRKELLSLPWRTESIQGSIYFVREELEAWQAAMEVMNIVSGRFGPTR